MIKKFIYLSALAASLLPLSGHAQALEKGFIKAFLVKGDVTLVDNSTGESKPLAKGDTFKDGTSVITTADSTAVLLLSNGSSIVVQPNTDLDIDNVQQAPFDPKKGSYLTLTADPSMSRTEVAINSGTIAGETKKLTNESVYDVKTPLGSAGIRGTKWGTNVTSQKVDGETVYTITYANKQGDVVFSTPISTGPVAPGDQVIVRGTVNDDGTITIDEVDTSTITNPAIVKAFEDLEVVTPEPPKPPQKIEQDQSDPDLNISPAGSENDLPPPEGDSPSEGYLHPPTVEN